jgi:hypothetical protein
MADWHEYSEDNKTDCKECKKMYKKHKDSDRQIEDYHQIVPLDKKHGIDASLSDLARGNNVRFKDNYTGLSQKDAYELMSDHTNSNTSSPFSPTFNKKPRIDASLSDLARGENVRFKDNYTGLSQKDAYELMSNHSNSTHTGGKRRKRKTNKRKTMKKRKGKKTMKKRNHRR